MHEALRNYFIIKIPFICLISNLLAYKIILPAICLLLMFKCTLSIMKIVGLYSFKTSIIVNSLYKTTPIGENTEFIQNRCIPGQITQDVLTVR